LIEELLYENEVAFFMSEKNGQKKVANRISHRYNQLPLLASAPGGVHQELVVPTCRCKGNNFLISASQLIKKQS